MGVRCAVLAGLLAFIAGCSGDAAQTRAPVDALERFLEAMDRSTAHEAALEEAYALLDRDSQAALTARAKQAAIVSGRELPPFRMIAQGRFRLRFAPAVHGGMRAKVAGDEALVRVVSEDGKSQVDVPMVRQDGRWRVKLGIPEARHGQRTAGPGADPAAAL